MAGKKPYTAIDHRQRIMNYAIGMRRQVTSIKLDIFQNIECIIIFTGRYSRYYDFTSSDPRGVFRIERMEHFAVDAFEFFPI